MAHLDYFSNKRVLITGASSGIGEALALALASAPGIQLVITGRNAERLNRVKSALGSACKAVILVDVCVKAENQRLADDIVTQLGGLDVVIFNAGTSEYVDLDCFDSTVYERIHQTNFMSLVYGFESLYPILKQSAFPHIVGIGSLASYAGMTRAGAYCASKSAVRAFFQSLQIDLNGKMALTLISPGFIKTPLTDKNTFPMPFRMSPEKGATLIAKAIAARKLEYAFPFFFSRMLKLLSSLPIAWQTGILTKVARRL